MQLRSECYHPGRPWSRVGDVTLTLAVQGHRWRDVSNGTLPGATDTMIGMNSTRPLAATDVTIHAVQFVGTNVEMTWTVDAPEDEAEARLNELLASKLGLFALTRTGSLGGRPRFSVIASPLDRLFHKIGPSAPLTVVKHASVTLDLSETNLTRQGHGFARTYPGGSSEDRPAADASERWRPWDVGKLVGTLLRRPALSDLGPVMVAGVPVDRGAFPHAILPELAAHVEEHGGVLVELSSSLRATLADDEGGPTG